MNLLRLSEQLRVSIGVDLNQGSVGQTRTGYNEVTIEALKLGAGSCCAHVDTTK